MRETGYGTLVANRTNGQVRVFDGKGGSTKRIVREIARTGDLERGFVTIDSVERMVYKNNGRWFLYGTD